MNEFRPAIALEAAALRRDRLRTATRRRRAWSDADQPGVTTRRRHTPRGDRRW